MRVLVPLCLMLIETSCLQLPSDILATIHATVFKDNNGALCLAVNQRITNRTKHMLIKWHWFWDQVKTTTNPNGPIEVSGISTEDQRADMMTKSLVRHILFENNRLAKFQGCKWQSLFAVLALYS